MQALDPDQLQRVLGAFDTVRDLSQPERERWLAACPERAIVAPLREMLAAHAEAGSFMEAPPDLHRWLGGAMASAFAPDVAAGEPDPGSEIGPYRLVRELGSGGMGAVWLAERADGLLKRPVALKLPHGGPHARALAQRFARERDILAALDHPGIARLFDAGVSAHGQPFLALEYVEGLRLDTYCDTHRLDVAARVALMVDVLDAVQYAHGQLVVHRDLKPANILVMPGGKVKLLDFGIARLLADATEPAAPLTQAGARVLTPDYASPEQITGGTLGVASDVYSLGVVLYEVLTGRRPYRARRDSVAALEDAIVDERIVPPSEAAPDAAAATARASDPARLRRRLKGDLDTIVMTALAREPARRFATCSAFAEDLRRYLDGRPVLARPVSRWVKTGKFLLRHRYGVGAAAVALLLVLGAAVAAVMQATRAREEALRADAIRRFVVEVFERNSATQADPEKARATTARQLLDLGRDQLLAAPPANPAVTEALFATFSEMYFQLGLPEAAERLDRLRLDLDTKAFGADDARTLDAMGSLVASLNSQGADDKTVEVATDLLARLDRVGDRTSALRARTVSAIAETLFNRGDPAAAAQQALAIALIRRHPDGRDFPAILANGARGLMARGDLANARVAIREALEAWKRQPLRSPVLGADLYTTAGMIYEGDDDLRGAEAALRESMAMERVVYADTWQADMAWLRLAALWSATGRNALVVHEGPAVAARAQAGPEVPAWYRVRLFAFLSRAAGEHGDQAAAASYAAVLEKLGCKVGDVSTDSACRGALLFLYAPRGAAAVQALLAEAQAQAAALEARKPAGFMAAGAASYWAVIGRTHLQVGALEAAAAAAQRARALLTAAAPVKPVARELRISLLERDVLRARGDRAGAAALDARMRAAIAAHPDRELLRYYEDLIAR